MTKTLDLHPLCSMFPRMGDEALHDLAADISAHGLLYPIVLFQGQILDGGNRYRACLSAGIEPTFTEFSGDDPAAFAVSVNRHRRHMTPGQMAVIAAQAQDWTRAQGRGGDGTNQHSRKAATLPNSSDSKPATLPNSSAKATVADRAAQAGVSERTQRMADKVAKSDPVLAKQVAAGAVSLNAAHKKVEGKADKKPAPAAAPEEDLGPSADELMTELQADNERLAALVKAAEADDTKAEAVRWRRAYEDAARKQGEAMDAVKRGEKREAFLAKQLQRCGRAVGETDPDKVAAAVEAFVRANGKVAA